MLGRLVRRIWQSPSTVSGLAFLGKIRKSPVLNIRPSRELIFPEITVIIEKESFVFVISLSFESLWRWTTKYSQDARDSPSA